MLLTPSPRSDPRPPLCRYATARDRWETVLGDPEMVRQTTSFYFATASWLKSLCGGGSGSAEAAIKSVPEFVIKDLAGWFSWLGWRHPKLFVVDAAKIEMLVGSVATLLSELDLAGAPVASSKIISLLRTLVEAGGSGNRPGSATALGGGRGWAWDGSGANDGQLAQSVLQNAEAQAMLPTALLKLYVAVDMIEGLDVDKEDFDKYRVKEDAAKLLERIWPVQAYRAVLVSTVCTPQFDDFILSFLEYTSFIFGGVFESLRELREHQRVKALPDWSRRSVFTRLSCAGQRAWPYVGGQPPETHSGDTVAHCHPLTPNLYCLGPSR